MRRHFNFILLSLILLFISFITTACGGSGSNAGCEFYGYPAQLTLSKYAFIINKGSVDNVIAYVDGVDRTNDAIFTLQSEESTQKETITKVEKGLINALEVGTSVYNVHVDYTQSDKTFTVTVIDPALPTLEVSKANFEIELGNYNNNEKITVRLNGKDVTNKVNFTSTNNNVAFIDENGKLNVVGEGEVNIIVHLDGANDNIIHIKVNTPNNSNNSIIDDSEYTVEKDQIKFEHDSHIYETEDGIVLYKGETGDLDVLVKGLHEAHKHINYVSENKNVITVDNTIDHGIEHGIVHALEIGKTIIDVDYEEDTKAIEQIEHILTKIHVLVLPTPELEKDVFDMYLGNTDQIKVNLNGVNINADCTFTTNDGNIATVDSNGIITSIGCTESGSINRIGSGATTGTTTLYAHYTDPETGRVFDLPVTVNTYKTTLTNDNGVNTTLLTDKEKEQMIKILMDTGMISNENDINEIIALDEEGLIKIIIKTDKEEGTKIAVISSKNGVIKYISTEEVDENGNITVDVNESPNNEVAEYNEDGTLETIVIPGFYNANNVLIAPWQDVTGDKVDKKGSLVFDENGNKVSIDESERIPKYQNTKRWNYEQHSNINGTANENDYRNQTQHFSNILKEHPELGNVATKLVIPDGVRVIGHYAFVSCKMALNTIVFPNTYDGITVNPDGTESFEGIGSTMSLVDTSYPKRKLMNYIIRTDNPHFDSIDGVIYSEDHTRLVACPMHKQYVRVIDGCEIFEECAFDGNDAITSVGPLDSGADVLVPNTVTTLYCRTFRVSTLIWVEFWDGLTCFGDPNVDQPASGDKTFYSATNANGSQIFKRCAQLKYVYIPASVTKIGYTYNKEDNRFESFAHTADGKTKIYCEIEKPENGIYPEGWNLYWNARSGNTSGRLNTSWNISRESFREICKN